MGNRIANQAIFLQNNREKTWSIEFWIEMKKKDTLVFHFSKEHHHGSWMWLYRKESLYRAENRFRSASFSITVIMREFFILNPGIITQNRRYSQAPGSKITPFFSVKNISSSSDIACATLLGRWQPKIYMKKNFLCFSWTEQGLILLLHF